jgi:hypothetical protein
MRTHMYIRSMRTHIYIQVDHAGPAPMPIIA